jgi:hypothetical protein
MFNWIKCYLSGRHEFGVKCEPGSIFLRCLHCGRRSPGWSLDEKAQSGPVPSRATSTTVTATVTAAPPGRVLPFGRAAS